MKLFKFIISGLIFCVFWDYTSGKSVNDVVNMAINQTKPHQLVFWKKLYLGSGNKTEYSSNHQAKEILNSVMKKIPTTLIDLNNPPPFIYFNRTVLRSNNIIYEYNINISAPLHIIFFDDKIDYLNLSLIHLLDVISDSVMYMSTPKCLFVLNQKNKSLSPIKDVLTIARRYQFFDFTVLQSIRNKPPVVFYYNVSLNSIEMRSNITANLKLFPEKLKNMNGYNMRVGVYRQIWPTYYKKYTGYPVYLISVIRLFKEYEYFAGFLNVTSTFVPIEYTTTWYGNPAIKDLEIVLDAYNPVHKTSSFTNVYIWKYRMLVALVPFVQETEINVPDTILHSFLSIVGVFLTILLFFKYSRYPSSEWSFILIFKLMFGIVTNFRPLSFRSKLVYVILLGFSVFLISDLVSDLTAIGLEIKEVLLGTSIDDILKKNVSVLTGSSCQVLNQIADSSDKRVKTLFKKCKFSSISDLKENEIHISPKEGAEVLFYYENSVFTTYNFSIVDMDLPIIIFANTFKKLSAFREKFGETESRIIESGLDLKWISDFNIRKNIKENIETGFEDKALAIKLICVMDLGMMVSVIFLML